MPDVFLGRTLSKGWALRDHTQQSEQMHPQFCRPQTWHLLSQKTLFSYTGKGERKGGTSAEHLTPVHRSQCLLFPSDHQGPSGTCIPHLKSDEALGLSPSGRESNRGSHPCLLGARVGYVGFHTASQCLSKGQPSHCVSVANWRVVTYRNFCQHIFIY